MAPAHFSLEADTSPGAKNPCDVCCLWGLVWFSSGRSLCSDYRILCASHFGRVHKVAADSAVCCSWWISWWAPKTLVLFANSILHWDYFMIVPLFRVFFLSLSTCSPITLLSFSAPNDRSVREWLISRGWIERCNLGSSCPISGEFSAAKSPAGIIDLAFPID